MQGGSGLARHWFHGRFQASALPLVKLWAVLRSDSHPAGGVGPACRSIRGRIRASTGPLVGLALPAPLGQGGGRQPSPPAVRGGIWADVSPLGRVWEMGPKRQPGTGGVAPAGTKILSAFGFQDFIAFFCPGSILRERGTT